MLVIVTPGDPDGIGPEISLKCASTSGVQLLFVGARKPFDEMGARVVEVTEEELKSGKARAPKPPCLWMLPAPTRAPKKSLFLEGYQSGWSIEKAAQLVECEVAHALVTGPISKERLQKGGFLFPGHTEFLAQLCGGSRRKALPVTMMLANDQLRVSLVTTHIGLKNVSRSLTRPLIRRAVTQTIEHLKSWWGIQRPRVAVAALNPHAGEKGLFGTEEIRTISPEILALRKTFKNSAEISGPLPADTLFAKNHLASDVERYDAVVCMYHDQGLIPVKLLDFRNTVNVTLGLPIVRTSVDHGVGFDIAKTGKADPSSLQSAIALAIDIVHKKTRS